MRSKLISVSAAALNMMCAGCLVGNQGLFGGWSGPNVWAEATEKIPLDAAGLEAIVVRTHNGAVAFEGQSPADADAAVTVTKKGGGRTRARAEEALAAIEVFVTPTGDGITKIGWKWKGIKSPGWRGQVSFAITGPESVHIDAETHNGRVQVQSATRGVKAVTHNGAVRVAGATGDVKAVTHNGSVDVDCGGGTLYAETHNGGIEARYAGDNLELLTHNGPVIADLSECHGIDADLTTHNGAVHVTVGEGTSGDLVLRTHNGRITCDPPVRIAEFSRHQLVGTLGDGGGTIQAVTHNGSIHLTKPKG
ncbi:MAG: hypothetical protein KJ749_04770 [Planctomycetes bacterium]|nr:hypothetical protein [Planctomycetota bacterium]